MNLYFKVATPCEMCKELKCGVVWYSVKRRVIRCMKCYDAFEVNRYFGRDKADIKRHYGV